MPFKKVTLTVIHKSIKLDQLDVSLSDLRITRLGEQEKMCRSLRQSGQLNPVLVRITDNRYQLLDGFKRYFSARHLGWDCLVARIVDVPLAKGKAMMLSYNKAGRSLLDYDEALVVCSLKREHLLDQSAISGLTGYSRSWVCRRLALIEKLVPAVQASLRMGTISNSQARAIVKLPRGNQQEVTDCIVKHHLSSRDSLILVEQFISSPDSKTQQYILSHPREVIQKSITKEEIYDSRLGRHGNRLLKSIELLLVQQNLFAGLCGQHITHKLGDAEKDILEVKMERLRKGSIRVESIIKDKTWKDEG